MIILTLETETSIYIMHHSNKSVFLQKCKNIWEDKRSNKVRWITAFLCSLAFSFTFFIFGPMEIFIQSQKYLTFYFKDMYVPIVLIGLAVFAVVSLVLIFVRGKIYNCLISILFGITVAGYIQGNFANVDHGSLDGTTVEWTEYAHSMIWNLVFWILVITVVFVLLYFSRKYWTYTLRILSVIIVGAQIVALFTIIPQIQTPENSESYISDKDEFMISEGNNVVVFLLDRWDNSYANSLLSKYPEWKTNQLSDFTYYDNFTGSYTRTMPSVCYLLTGIQEDYTLPYDEYFTKAWTESTFLPDIRKAGYGTRVYSEMQYVFGNAKNLEGKIDNISNTQLEVDNKLLIKDMLSLSAYRYMPEGLKPYYRLYTGDLAKISTTTGDNSDPHVTDDIQFWGNYQEQGLDVNESSKGEFVFYHLSGAHEPLVMNANGEKIQPGESKTYMGQLTGNLKWIFAYMEELKEKGLYDKTTIILTADHGLTGTWNQLDKQRVLSLFIKPANTTQTEMQVSHKQICQDNLRSSIVSYFGLDTSNYARTIESIGEDEEMTRVFWMQSCGSDTDLSHRDVYTVTYEIKGNANDFANWKIINKVKIQYPFYDVDSTKGL